MQVIFDTRNIEDVKEVKYLIESILGTPVSVTETVSEDTKTEVVIPTQPEEVETSPEPAEEEKPKRKSPAKKDVTITLQDLKDLAKAKVIETSRDDVKKAIGVYGGKLTEVKVNDYVTLKADLETLGA